jgi:hypothetical protein
MLKVDDARRTTHDDGRRTQGDHNSSPWAMLRWAKNTFFVNVQHSSFLNFEFRPGHNKIIHTVFFFFSFWYVCLIYLWCYEKAPSWRVIKLYWSAFRPKGCLMWYVTNDLQWLCFSRVQVMSTFFYGAIRPASHLCCNPIMLLSDR